MLQSNDLDGRNVFIDPLSISYAIEHTSADADSSQSLRDAFSRGVQSVLEIHFANDPQRVWVEGTAARLNEEWGAAQWRRARRRR